MEGLQPRFIPYNAAIPGRARLIFFGQRIRVSPTLSLKCSVLQIRESGINHSHRGRP